MSEGPKKPPLPAGVTGKEAVEAFEWLREYAKAHPDNRHAEVAFLCWHLAGGGTVLPLRMYHARGHYWEVVPTFDWPCDICGKPFAAHARFTHTCPPQVKRPLPLETANGVIVEFERERETRWYCPALRCGWRGLDHELVDRGCPRCGEACERLSRE